MCNDKLAYKVVIWVSFGISLEKEKVALSTVTFHIFMTFLRFHLMITYTALLPVCAVSNDNFYLFFCTQAILIWLLISLW